VLRSIKQSHERTYYLHSFIGIGPFSILTLTGKSSSPLNVIYAIPTPYWNLEDVRNLFSQYSSTIDPQMLKIFFKELVDMLV